MSRCVRDFREPGEEDGVPPSWHTDLRSDLINQNWLFDTLWILFPARRIIELTSQGLEQDVPFRGRFYDQLPVPGTELTHEELFLKKTAEWMQENQAKKHMNG